MRSSASVMPADVRSQRPRRIARVARIALVPAVAFGMLVSTLHGVPPAAAQDDGPTQTVPAPTRRPTRTPRATPLPTSTPVSAGAMRLTLSTSPRAPQVGEPMVVRASLESRAQDELSRITVDLELSSEIQVQAIDPGDGTHAVAGTTIRWSMPRIAPGDEVQLEVHAIPSIAAASVPLCAFALSAGPPLEFCTSFEIVPTGGRGGVGETTVTGRGPVPPTGVITAPIGIGLEDVADDPESMMGWAVLLVGLAVLGGWAGATWGGRRRRLAGKEGGMEKDVTGPPDRAASNR